MYCLGLTASHEEGGLTLSMPEVWMEVGLHIFKQQRQVKPAPPLDDHPSLPVVPVSGSRTNAHTSNHLGDLTQ